MVGCGSPPVPPAPIANTTPIPLRCPPPDPQNLESEGPPWERDPLGRWPQCIETADGARVTEVKDPTDGDGWRVTLVAEDSRGKRFALPTRAISAMAIAPDNSIALVHVEDAVTLVTPTGRVAWKTDHPKCGAPSIAVGYAGEVVLACGYSLLAFSPAGRFLWQKWPFGDTHVSRPLLARDGTMYVSGGGRLVALDRAGEQIWKLDTGGNRYVHLLGVAATGELVFRTSMAERHTSGSMRIYHQYEPPELFVVTRDGKLVSKREVEHATAWPPSVPWDPALRAGRLP